PGDHVLASPGVDVDLETHFGRFKLTRAWSLQVRFTDSKDFPNEEGSAGPREAVLHPLGLAKDGERTIAAPVVSSDRVLDRFSGGRWVLACCTAETPFPVDLIERLCDYAIRPRADIQVQPGFACYYPGEYATLNVRVRSCGATDLKVNLRVFSQVTQKELYAHTYKLEAGASRLSPVGSRQEAGSSQQSAARDVGQLPSCPITQLLNYSAPLSIQTSPFPTGDPGLYIVRANVEGGGRNKPIGHAETGFWVYDRDLISCGKPLTTDHDYFYRDGRPYPI